MQLDTFKREFRQLNGVTLEDSWVLFRRPLQLYNLETGETVEFKNLDEALAYELDGKTLEQRISQWTSIAFRRDGGRGSGSGLATFSFGHARGGGGDAGKPDHPARINARIGINRTPEDTLRAFRDAHVNDSYESGVAVDEHGFVTRYVHGTATSVAIYGRKGEIVYHNHPGKVGGNFSDSDLLSTAMSAERGIVASAREGATTSLLRPTNSTRWASLKPSKAPVCRVKTTTTLRIGGSRRIRRSTAIVIRGRLTGGWTQSPLLILSAAPSLAVR